MSLHQIIDNIFQLVELLLIVRILLTWFPNIQWWKQPFKFIEDFSEPIFTPFRKLIPPMGGIDISPIFAFLALNIVQTVILSIV